MPFLDSLDIANRALQHCGARAIATPTEDSKNNKETAFAYDKVRRAELRRNVWRFAVRKAILRAVDNNTMILDPADYDSTKTYLPGAIVEDANDQFWISNSPDNINNTPGDIDVWDMYFGPLTVMPWDAAATYSAGEIVYKPTAVAGGFKVYMSLQNSNADVPDVATAYDATVIYHRDAVVSSGGFQWRSLIEVNLGITPAVGPLAYDNAATYSTGQTVTASDNFIYSSVGNGNIGNNPPTDGGVHWTNTNRANAWARSPTIQVSASSWRVIDANINNLIFNYPIGSGPSSQAATRNVYRVPAGFLRLAPQDPKAGSTSSLGAPSGLAYSDWLMEGDYIITQDAGPLMIRFVADVTKVSAMDDMFCEGLACRIATAICEPLTQSTEKLQAIEGHYKKLMGEARQVNAIENGATEPPTDDWIACRA